MESVGSTKKGMRLSLGLGQWFPCWALCQVLWDGTSFSSASRPMGRDLLLEPILYKKNPRLTEVKTLAQSNIDGEGRDQDFSSCSFIR